MNHYMHVFFESVWGASIVPFSNEASFAAMRAFGGFDMPKAAALGICGAMLGQGFNWIIGRLLLALKRRGPLKISEGAYARAERFFHSYGIFLLFFCWVPLCNVIVVIAAFLNTRPRIALPLILAGEIINYGRYLIPA